MQMNQGKFRDVEIAARRLQEISPSYASERQVFNAWLEGNDSVLHARIDSLDKLPDLNSRESKRSLSQSIALRGGRLHEARVLAEGRNNQPRVPEEEIGKTWLELAIRGPSAPVVVRLDSIIARIPFRELPFVDRPYLLSAATLARAGNAQGARAMIARYRAEVTDTALLRDREADLHSVLGEIALAENKPQIALAEFRRSDFGYDGAPAGECAPCLPFDLARAFDVAGQSDSAAMMFERYLSTPYWLKALPQFDPVIVPAIRERLGQLYESMGNTDKAVENYRAFIDLWKNADPELQPRVAEARRRLVKLTPVEKPRP
jgi:tetratricopeptide (TPR) repeat protein